MKHTRFLAPVLAAALLAGCGGGSPPQFASIVSFGDSLSDVGSYAVGTVQALGGGKYTINGAGAQNWVEVMAQRMNVSAPCAAQRGLNGDVGLGFSIPVTNHPTCTAYAQGGARVTHPVGPGNAMLPPPQNTLGQLTVPVQTQIQNHLASRGGRFAGNEMVFVLAGGNDVFMQLAAVGAGTAPADAVTAMGVAGAELAGYVRNQIVANGARFVTVVNLPDVSISPFALNESAGTQALISSMVTTFNAQLQQGLAGLDVAFVDAYTASRHQSANPALYGISNAMLPACDLAGLPLPTSLVCTNATLAVGADTNFLFADGVHPTPLGYRLLADLVSAELRKRAWM